MYPLPLHSWQQGCPNDPQEAWAEARVEEEAAETKAEEEEEAIHERKKKTENN